MLKKTKIIFEGEKNMLNMKSGENTDRKELDKQEALDILQNKLNEAEISIQKEGTISAEELEAELQDILLRVEDDVKNERVDSIENTFSDVRKML